MSLEYAAGNIPDKPTPKKPTTTRQEHSKMASREANQRRRQLKRNQTPAEKHFSSILDMLKISHQKQEIVFCDFRYFIVDFVIKVKPFAIVEIDGDSHVDRHDYDEMRTRMILQIPEYKNMDVIRIYNEQVFNGVALRLMAERYPRLWKKYQRRSK
jgi:very-short-patch-repair endonuclease